LLRQFFAQEVVSAGFIAPETLYGSINPAGTPAATTNYTNGTGSLQVDTIHAKPYLLSAATTQIDLTSLLDLFGGTANFARVREFVVFNPDTTSTHDVKIYQGASNPWVMVPTSGSPAWARNNGGLYNLSDPVSTGSSNGNVTSGTSKTIIFDPGANTITVWILILGGSVA